MSGGRLRTRTVTTLGMLTAVALVLGYLEHLIPITTIPGIKLGLSNTVLLYALYLMNGWCAAVLMCLKVVLSGLLFGGVSAMLYSLAGGILSLAAMLLIRRIPGVSVIGVSIIGAVMHNVGQLIVASFVVETQAVLVYLPVLLVSAAVTGTLTGIVAKYVMRGLKGNQGARTTNSTEDKK